MRRERGRRKEGREGKEKGMEGEREEEGEEEKRKLHAIEASRGRRETGDIDSGKCSLVEKGVGPLNV